MKENKILLEYQDVIIYQSDLHILKSRTGWLNDSCINFQMTRLRQNRRNKVSMTDFKDSDEVSSTPIEADVPKVLYFDPMVVSYFMQFLGRDDVDEMLELRRQWDLPFHLNLESNPIETMKPELHLGKNCSTCDETAIILVPVNDYHAHSASSWQSKIPGGGNHWSLLAVIISPNDAYGMHFDSMAGCNCKAAELVAKKVLQICSARITDNFEADAIKISSYQIKVIECKCPQQQNGYDCGIHTLAAAQAFSDVNLKINRHTNETSIKELLENTLANFIVYNGGEKEMPRRVRENIAADICFISAKNEVED